MPTMTFVLPDGSRRTVVAAEDLSILEIAHAEGIAIEGACDGSMACSTCHVIVDKAWWLRLPPAAEEELDMLDFAVGATETSRLGCQVRVTGDLDGLVVTVPAETRNALLG
ncbi:MAG: 2Fe-2S iron-sulfur cluster-binding protein [Rhodospirillales bacterium]|jgi:2Fe-2S ferredoxin|nr:2Fe-2S iron-sulfur cluster-binding protein [Rhodospirillales bacterium]